MLSTGAYMRAKIRRDIIVCLIFLFGLLAGIIIYIVYYYFTGPLPPFPPTTACAPFVEQSPENQVIKISGLFFFSGLLCVHHSPLLHTFIIYIYSLATFFTSRLDVMQYNIISYNIMHAAS